MASVVLVANHLNCGNRAELTAFEHQAILGKHFETSCFIKDTSYYAFLLLYLISVEVYCAYKKTSPIECKSGDCSG